MIPENIRLEAMPLHIEIYNSDIQAWITRVPGGWLYKYYSHSHVDCNGYSDDRYLTPVFVPEVPNGL